MGVEEEWCRGRTNGFLWGKGEVEKHPTKPLRSVDGLFGAVRWGEEGGELTRAQVGRGETLAALQPATELVPVLRGVGVGLAAQHHVGLDEVRHVAQRQRVALRAVARSVVAAAAAPSPLQGRPFGLAVVDLVPNQ